MATSDNTYEKWLNTPYVQGQTLPSNHPYLRMLRGDFKDVEEEVQEALEWRRDQQSPAADDQALSDLGTESLKWEIAALETHEFFHEALTIRLPYLSQTQATEAAPSLPLEVFCNNCQEPIDLAEKYGYFHCAASKETHSDCIFCVSCVESGTNHDSPEHSLRLVKTTEFRFGQAIRIYAAHTHHSEPSSQFRSAPQNTLAAIVDKYIQRKEVNDFLIKNGFRTIPSNLSTTICVFRWSIICLLLANDQFQPSFRSSLQPIHLAIVRLILEWWLGDIQNIELTCLGLNGSFLTSMFGMTTPSDGETLHGRRRSRYHEALLNLIDFEMQDNSIFPSMDIQPIRILSAHSSSVQRLAFAHLYGVMRPSWHNPTEDIRVNARVYFTTVYDCFRYPMTVGLQKDKMQTMLYFTLMSRACVHAWELAIENIRSADQILGSKQLKASISPCPWLTPVELARQFPFFLWNKRRRSTVRTQDLPYLPEYTVVSHTWGRWKKDPKQYPEISLSNVLWNIPPNTRFDVERIGDILHSVPGDSPYVWFDLVCIPQTRDGDLGKIARQEIEKQAAIFSLAESAVAWFCDLDNFGPLEDLCHILAANAARYPGRGTSAYAKGCQRIEDLLRRVLVDQYNERNCPLARSEYPHNIDLSWNEFLHEWFTSLWTLQEACMRPDMWLCCRDWTLLVSSATGSKIPLDCVLSLVSANTNIIKQWAQPTTNSGPSGSITSATEVQANLEYKPYEVPAIDLIPSPPPFIVHFTHSIRAAGLTEIPDINRMRIMVLGNQRTCQDKSQRSIAIMSAMGVTNWYDPSESNSQEDEKDLVLGRYRWELVNELRQAVGDYEFFSCNIVRDFWATLDPARVEDELLARDDVRGTLLPFAPVESHGASRIPIETVVDITDESQTHATVSDWWIGRDGSVNIPSAWLLGSSANPGKVNVGTVYLGDFFEAARGWASVTSEQPLREWIASRSYKCHAVGIRRQMQLDHGDKKHYVRIDGLLLRELKNGSLFKMGWFGTKVLDGHDFGFSTSEDVKWTVL